MSLREELRRLIAVERDRLARREAKRAEVAANEERRNEHQRAIFQPVATALTEMRDALDRHDGVEIIVYDNCALIRLNTGGGQDAWQELEISTCYTSWSGPMHCDDDGFVVRSMVSDFPAEDVDDVARPDRKHFESAAALTDWLSQKIARTAAFNRYVGEAPATG